MRNLVLVLMLLGVNVHATEPAYAESRTAVVKAACATVDINHLNCLNDAFNMRGGSVAQMIEQLCSRHNAWGTSNVFVNCAVNAIHASEDPVLIGAAASCLEQHSWASEYFMSKRATCLHSALAR